jgi:restriction system protein
MALWQVRIGRGIEREQAALDKAIVFVGWEALPNLASIQSQAELETFCKKTYPNEKARTLSSWARQIWTFLKRIEPGDLVIIPLKSRSAYAVGKIIGPYQYCSDLPKNLHHARSVEWIKKEIPRSSFDSEGQTCSPDTAFTINIISAWFSFG